MYNRWQLTQIGEIYCWTEKDGSLFMRRDGLKGPITPSPQMRKLANILFYKYITFQLKIIMKVSLKARSNISHKLKIILLRKIASNKTEVFKIKLSF